MSHGIAFLTLLILPQCKFKWGLGLPVSVTKHSKARLSISQNSCFVARVATVEELKQYYVLMSADVKDAYMMHVLDTYSDANPKSSIMIFTSTCK